MDLSLTNLQLYRQSYWQLALCCLCQLVPSVEVDNIVMVMMRQARMEVVKVSIFFFLLYSADTSCNTIISYIFQKLQLPNVGPTSLAVQYLTYVLSLILAPGAKIKPKNQLLLGSFLHIINYSLAVVASLISDEGLVFALMCVGLGVGGFGSGFMWVSQGRHVHMVCQIFEVSAKRGKLFGIFQIFYCMAMLCGALVTLFGIGFFSVTIYFLILTGLGVASFLYCLFFVSEVDSIGQKRIAQLELQQPTDYIDKIEQIRRLLQQANSHLEEKKYKIGKFLRGFFSYMPVMFCLVPTLLVEALATGIRLNQLTHLIPPDYSETQRNRSAALCQIFAGVGCVLGGYVASHLTDYLGTIRVTRLALAIFPLFCGLYILAVFIESIALAYLSSFLWGFLLFAFVGLVLIIISRHFDGQAEGFAINRMVTAMFMIVFQGAMIASENAIVWQVYIGFALTAVPALYFVGRLPRNSSSICQDSREGKVVDEGSQPLKSDS